jgi:hypothetical protein
MTVYGPAPAPASVPPRRGGRTRRLAARVGAVALILATITAARAIDATTPIGQDHARPWIHPGQMNETVIGNDLAVRVLGVRGARAYSSGGRMVTTDGLFLLVRVRVQAIGPDPASVAYAALVDAEETAYAATGFGTLFGYRVHPGITVDGELLFELPATRVDQLRLRLSSYPDHRPRFQVMIEVPLQIDADEIRLWSGQLAALTVREPEVVG